MNSEEEILNNYPELKKIAGDNVSGSRTLLLKLNSWLCRNYSKIPNLQSVISSLKLFFGEFQAISRYLIDLEILLTENSSEKLKSFFKTFEYEQEKEFTGLIKRAVAELKKYSSFLTISNSETIKKFFHELSNQKTDLEVVISESRPMNEGRILAEQLLNKNIKTELITEAMLSLRIKSVDCVVLGCDKILRNGNVINKIGSKTVAILSKEFFRPCYVIAYKYKFSNDNYFTPLLRPSSEIWDKVHPLLTINNIYFEEIDKSYITQIIS